MVNIIKEELPIEESLGLIPNLEKLKLVGPSNYGLSIPMQNTAISLVHI